MALGVLCVEKQTQGKGEFRFLKKELYFNWEIIEKDQNSVRT